MKFLGKHSMHRGGACGACGDLDGCHLPARIKAAVKPRVVCLCGSTRFRDAFTKANYDETMNGKIVLTVGFIADRGPSGGAVGCTADQKDMLDLLHCQKIDMADEVLVLNVDGYIGESTYREVQYAYAQGKAVRYLEDNKTATEKP